MDDSVRSSVEEIKSESTNFLDEVKNTFEGITNILNNISDVDSSDADSSDTEIYNMEEFEVRSSVNNTSELVTPNASKKEDKSTKKELTTCCDATDVDELSNEISDNSEVEDESKVKDDDSLKEDSDQENLSRQKENESSAETKMSSSAENSENKMEKPQMSLGPDFDNVNPFEVIVPLIGKREFPATIDKPFAHRYDLAMEFNRLKCIEQMEESKSILAFKKRQDARTPEEVELYKRLEKISAMQKAAYLTKIAIRILREITQDEEFDEDYIIKYFSKFMNISVSYLALLYSPHLVHTLMYIRGCDAFSHRIRSYADECYWKCHALFGIPDGYNFQTVYLSDMKKYGLKDMDHCLKSINLMRDYGDYESDSCDSEDSAFYELDSNDS